jgi:hypothetical protein
MTPWDNHLFLCFAAGLLHSLLNKKTRAHEAEGGIQTLAKSSYVSPLPPVAFGCAVCETLVKPRGSPGGHVRSHDTALVITGGTWFCQMKSLYLFF